MTQDENVPPPKVNVAVRLAVDLHARLVALAPRLSTRWRDATLSDVLRAILVIGVEVVETDPGVLDRLKPAAARR
jgi:hypothetical protein